MFKAVYSFVPAHRILLNLFCHLQCLPLAGAKKMSVERLNELMNPFIPDPVLSLLAITLSGVIFMAGPNICLQKACQFSEAQPNLPSSEGLLQFPRTPLVPVS